jgi:hypothetical protein
MQPRIIVGALVLGSVLGGTVATSGKSIGTRQWAVAYMAEPTLIESTIVQGPVLFTHDDAKMARGEPCTAVYLFEPGKGPAEKIASFHCIPRPSTRVPRFTITTRSNATLGFGCVLTSYQFAGDAEAHGVPIPADAH